jgi:hypothetical protein
VDDNAILDAVTADLFTLDRREEPAEDLTEYACSENCTDRRLGFTPHSYP